MSKTSNLEFLQNIVAGKGASSGESRFHYPPPIARTLGFNLVAVGPATATIEIDTDPAIHANPMGTIHGGVIGDVADAAIGTAHSTTLDDGESFTSVDLQINFFRPVWKEKLRAIAKPVHSGKTITRYTCDVTNADGKLVAQVMSTVMTLRQDAAKGR